MREIFDLERLDSTDAKINVNELSKIVDSVFSIFQLMYADNNDHNDRKKEETLMNDLLPLFVEPAYLYDVKAAINRFLEKFGLSTKSFYFGDEDEAVVIVVKDPDKLALFFNYALETFYVDYVIASMQETNNKNKQRVFDQNYGRLTGIARFLMAKNFFSFSLIHKGIIDENLPKEDIEKYYKCVNNTFRNFSQYLDLLDNFSAFLVALFGARAYNAFMAELCNIDLKDQNEFLNFIYELTKIIELKPVSEITNAYNASKYQIPIFTFFATEKHRLFLTQSIISSVDPNYMDPNGLMRAIKKDWDLLHEANMLPKLKNVNDWQSAQVHQIIVKYILKSRLVLYQKLFNLIKKKYKGRGKMDLLLNLYLAIKSIQDILARMISANSNDIPIIEKGTSSKRVLVHSIN